MPLEHAEEADALLRLAVRIDDGFLKVSEATSQCVDTPPVGQIVPVNPASSVRGPKHVVHRGKTPVLKSDQARALLDSIDTKKIVGLRDGRRQERGLALKMATR